MKLLIKEIRTNAACRRGVMALLRDPEWSKMSDREIARTCAVSQPFVGKVRDELSDNRYQIDKPTERTVTRGGTTYTQNTTNIGVRPEPEPEPQPDPAPRAGSEYRVLSVLEIDTERRFRDRFTRRHTGDAWARDHNETGRGVRPGGHNVNFWR